jgi:hypothetical protein
MDKRHIIFIPGKNPKPPENLHKDLLWRTMIEGIRRAAPEIASDLQLYKDHFHLVGWNYTFYNIHKDGTRDIPWIDTLINNHGPSPSDVREANAWHKRIDRMLYTIADHFQFIIRWLPGPAIETIKETQRYFENHDNIAYHIREIVKKTVRPLLKDGDKVLVIGHSLGSIIAYDTFWEMTHLEHRKDKIDFLTLGSPLGMNFVQHRLLGHKEKNHRRYPANIQHWYNVASVGDVTALDRHFKDDFRNMIKLGLIDTIEDHCDGIYNFFRNEEGLNCHRSYGYLVNPAVGQIIANWWQNSA